MVDTRAAAPEKNWVGFVRVLGAAVAAGLFVGVLIGGVGGRIAMRVLAVTSDDRLDGALTDDEEVVGRITAGGTIGLIIFIGLLGVALALLYVVLRRWLPRNARVRILVFAGLLWAIQGSDMFHSDSFDFNALTPHWLAVAMFSAILLGAGAVTAALVDAWMDRWPAPAWRTAYAYLPLLPMLLFFPVVVPIAMVGATAWAIQRYPAARRIWEARAMTIAGGVILAAIGVPLGIVTAREVAEILG